MTQTLPAALVVSLLGLLGLSGAAHAQTAAEPAPVMLAALSVRAAPFTPSGATAAALRADLDAAAWPGDIVRAADLYLQLVPGDREVETLRAAASASLAVLRRSDVALLRAHFDVRDPALADDVRRAARGDRSAAVRLAQASRAHDPANGTRRYIGWMQFAALLGDADASYELARHFRRDGQSQLSATYENLALALGHVPPASLEHRR